MPMLERAPARLLAAATKPDPTPSRLDGVFLEHLHYEEAREHLWERVTSRADHFLVLLVGPTGVGKSELVDRMVATIHELFTAAMLADSGFRPVAVLPAPPVFNGRIDFAAFFEQVFVKAGGVAYHRRLPNTLTSDGSVALRRLGQQKAIEVFEAAAEQVLLAKTQVIVVEEARPFAAAARSSNASDHADVIKAFAQLTGCRLVLVGTYGLLALRHISSELSRRTRTVEFQRYRFDDVHQADDFTAIASEVLGRFPGEDVSGDTGWARELHDGTLGCIGTLLDWFRSAESLIEERGPGTSLGECLRDSEWSAADRAEAVSELEGVEFPRPAPTPAGPSPQEAAVPPVAPSRSGSKKGPRPRPKTASGQTLNPGELGPRHYYLDLPKASKP